MTFFHEAILYKSLQNNRIQCQTCWHQCKIDVGKYGLCRTRTNKNGILYCNNYGLISTYSINPIEKKPLFHYYPGSYAATIGSFSCNFSCIWCQNWSISKVYPSEVGVKHFLSPHELIERVKSNPSIKGISISFNEPTLSIEYALDVFNLCTPSMYRMFVTNGYMTNLALDMLIEAGMTGLSVNVKGSSQIVKKYCKAKVEKVWENIKIAHEKGVHIEIICLIIPGVNDLNEFFNETAKTIFQIDSNIPLHFTRFSPAYKLKDNYPTPILTLEKAYQIARANGLNYVYLGNVFGHSFENTYCPKCSSMLIQRTGYEIDIKLDLRTQFCPNCGFKVPFYT